MTILAIDPGRTTGWALSTGETGSYVGPVGDDGETIARYWQWLGDMLSEHGVKRLIVERAWLGRVRDADFTLTLIRSAHAIAWMHGIPRAEFSANQVRQSVFGKGEYTKIAKKDRDRERIKKAVSMGWQVDTDHAADGALLLEAWKIDAARDARA